MITSTITKIKNGTVILPKYLQKYWRRKQVLITPFQDRIIIQSLEQDWDQYESKLKAGKKLISSVVLKETIRYAKKR